SAHDLALVLEESHHAQYRRGVNSLAQSFVIEADIAPRDWDIKFFAGARHPINNLRKLPHDVRLFRIAEVQAISRAHGRRARAADITRSLRDRVHRAEARIEIAPATVSIE